MSEESMKIRKTKTGGLTTKLPHQVLRRNERERRRVEQVNRGFVDLRKHVPQSWTNKKLSKVETLREAARYIKYLESMLHDNCEKPFETLNPPAEASSKSHEQCVSQENQCASPLSSSFSYQQMPHSNNAYPMQYFSSYGPNMYHRSDNFYHLRPQITDVSSNFYSLPEMHSPQQAQQPFQPKNYEL